MLDTVGYGMLTFVLPRDLTVTLLDAAYVPDLWCSLLSMTLAHRCGEVFTSLFRLSFPSAGRIPPALVLPDPFYCDHYLSPTFSSPSNP